MGTQFGLRRLTGAIGAEVSGINLNSPLDETTVEEVHQAFLEHCVLVFRGQFLKPAAQVAFTRRWGEAVVTPYLKLLQVPDYPEIIVVPNPGKARHSPRNGTPTHRFCRLLRRTPS
jgi:taurine dioxygenase